MKRLFKIVNINYYNIVPLSLPILAATFNDVRRNIDADRFQFDSRLAVLQVTRATHVSNAVRPAHKSVPNRLGAQTSLSWRRNYTAADRPRNVWVAHISVAFDVFAAFKVIENLRL
jgi:hypothetical protein